MRHAFAMAAALAVAFVGSAALAATVPAPVLEYRFDDVSGSVVPNHGSLGTGGNGTLVSGTTTAAGAPQFTGDSLFIDSGSDKMSTADLTSAYSHNEFTVAFWYNPATIGNWKEILGDVNAGPTNATRGWNIELMTGGIIRFRSWTGSANMGERDSGAGLVTASEWQHIAIVANGLTTAGTRTITIDFYRNGVWHSTHSGSSSSQMASATEGFKIGDTHWDQYQVANFGQVMLFDEALTADQVAMVSGNVAIPEPAAALTLLGAAGLMLRRRRA